MNCLFCSIVAGTVPSQKIYETDSLLAFLDIHPTNPGHVIVIPKVHYDNYLDAPASVLTELAGAMQQLAPPVLAAVGADAWNLIVNSGRNAGQVIFHVHFHLVPRFLDDGFRHWKGNPEHEQGVDSVAEKIRAALQQCFL